MISSNELFKPEQKVKVILHLYNVQVYKGIEQGYQVSIRAITKTCATQSNFLHPLLHNAKSKASQGRRAQEEVGQHQVDLGGGDVAEEGEELEGLRQGLGEQGQDQVWSSGQVCLLLQVRDAHFAGGSRKCN